jgi:hypothetical protein
MTEELERLRAENAAMRAIFARLFEDAKPLFDHRSEFEGLEFKGSGRGFVGAASLWYPDVLDKLADAFVWVQENPVTTGKP